DGHKLGHELLYLADGGHSTLMRVVLQVPAAAPAESGQSSRSKMIPLVEQKCARGLVEDFQQAVDVHEGDIVDRQEVSGAWRVGRPSVRIDVEQWIGRGGGTSVFDFHAAAAVELGEGALSAKLDELGDISGRQLTGPADQPG